MHGLNKQDIDYRKNNGLVNNENIKNEITQEPIQLIKYCSILELLKIA